MYTCRTSIGKTFSLILVILNFHGHEALRFLYEPADHSAVERKRVHFTCIFRDIPDNMERKYDVIWTKNSDIINNLSNGFDLDRFTFHNEYADGRHRLRIDPVKREDGGVYRCHFRYNGDIFLTSAFGKLTIREIPSNEYPLIELGKKTYRTGEEVTIRCFCEKTNPMAELDWLRPSKIGILGLTTNPRENNTHIWIEITVPANLELNGVFFECRIIVGDETAPRYKSSRRLHIIDGSKLFKTTSKKPSRQTQQDVTRSLSNDIVLSETKAENKESNKEVIQIISLTLGFISLSIIILLIAAVSRIRKIKRVYKGYHIYNKRNYKRVDDVIISKDRNG